MNFKVIDIYDKKNYRLKEMLILTFILSSFFEYFFLLQVDKKKMKIVFFCIHLELESKHEFVVKVRDMVKTWPRPIFVVMRYLFAFLNHLSEFR